MSSPPAVVFQPRYLGWLIGVVLIVLAVLGLLGVVPFTPTIFWGAHARHRYRPVPVTDVELADLRAEAER